MYAYIYRPPMLNNTDMVEMSYIVITSCKIYKHFILCQLLDHKFFKQMDSGADILDP